MGEPSATASNTRAGGARERHSSASRDTIERDGIFFAVVADIGSAELLNISFSPLVNPPAQISYATTNPIS